MAFPLLILTKYLNLTEVYYLEIKGDYMSLKNILFSIATMATLNCTSLWADCAGKDVAIYVVKLTSLHTGLIIPNTNHIFKDEFKDAPYIVVNWGSELFYRAGSDEKEQLAAAPAALLMEGPGVVLIEPQYRLNNVNNSASESAKINISKEELSKLENAILKLVKKDNKGELLKLATNGKDNSLAQYDGNFYRSTVNYQGIKLTCNGMIGNLLSENTENFGKFNSYLPNPLMQYLEEKSKDASTCIETNAKKSSDCAECN
jgi:hypothetical protein